MISCKIDERIFVHVYVGGLGVGDRPYEGAGEGATEGVRGAF